MDSEQEHSAGNVREEPYNGAGHMLRTAREDHGLALSDVATRTRIPIRQLEVIESGAFDALPSRTYAIGFARTYARCVGLDEGPITQAVRDELGDAPEPRMAITDNMEPGDPAKLPSRGLAWAAGGAALLLALGLFFSFGNYFGASEGAPPLVADGADETAPIEGAQDSAPDAAPSADAAVVFTALADGIWVRLYEEGGERLLERTLAKGESFTVPAGAEDPRLNTGRPDALEITIDGKPTARLAERAISLGSEPVSAAALLARPNAGSALPTAPPSAQVSTPASAPTPTATGPAQTREAATLQTSPRAPSPRPARTPDQPAPAEPSPAAASPSAAIPSVLSPVIASPSPDASASPAPVQPSTRETDN